MDDLLTNPHKASGTTTKNEEDLDYLIEYDSRTSFSSTSQENEASGEIEYDASSVISSTQKEGAGVVSPSEIEYNDGSQFSSTQKGAAVSQTKLYTQKFEIIERLFQTQTSGPKHGE